MFAAIPYQTEPYEVLHSLVPRTRDAWIGLIAFQAKTLSFLYPRFGCNTVLRISRELTYNALALCNPPSVSANEAYPAESLS